MTQTLTASPATGAAHPYALPKRERLCARKDIDALFGGEGRAMTSFPIRAVYAKAVADSHSPAAQMMVSVPKKHIRHAVGRNRIKRQVREAYRLNKPLLSGALDVLTAQGRCLHIAFIWLDDRQRTSEDVTRHITALLQRIGEKIQRKDT